jgi:hypothetical protein
VHAASAEFPDPADPTDPADPGRDRHAPGDLDRPEPGDLNDRLTWPLRAGFFDA